MSDLRHPDRLVRLSSADGVCTVEMADRVNRNACSEAFV